MDVGPKFNMLRGLYADKESGPIAGQSHCPKLESDDASASKADVGWPDLECPLWVISGHLQRTSRCPLSASSGLVQRSKVGDSYTSGPRDTFIRIDCRRAS